MLDHRTTHTLVHATEILPADVDAAVIAFLVDQAPGPVSLGSGYAIDVAEALGASRGATAALAQQGATGAFLHGAVRTAVLLGRPVRVAA